MFFSKILLLLSTYNTRRFALKPIVNMRVIIIPLKTLTTEERSFPSMKLSSADDSGWLADVELMAFIFVAFIIPNPREEQ